jgi:hypothetical protein
MCGIVKGTLKNKTRIDTQMKFYKNMTIMSDLYGCEAWVMTSRDKSRLQAAETGFLR